MHQATTCYFESFSWVFFANFNFQMAKMDVWPMKTLFVFFDTFLHFSLLNWTQNTSSDSASNAASDNLFEFRKTHTFIFTRTAHVSTLYDHPNFKPREFSTFLPFEGDFWCSIWCWIQWCPWFSDWTKKNMSRIATEVWIEQPPW